MADPARLFWKAIHLWAAISLLIFALLGAWSLVGFSLTYAVVFGGFLALGRPMTRGMLHRWGIAGAPAFLAVGFGWGVFEELWCNAFGCTLALPVLWVDLVWVGAVFTGWFAAWYFVLSKRFRFREEEALVLGSLMGIFFELVLPGRILAEPLGSLLIAPLAVLIYRALFIVPMALMDFSGTHETPWKYAAAIALPVLAAAAAALLTALALSWAGAPLTAN